MALVLDGWLAWCHANAPAGMANVNAAIAATWNAYTHSCERAGGPRLQAQRRVVEIFKERQIHGPPA